MRVACLLAIILFAALPAKAASGCTDAKAGTETVRLTGLDTAGDPLLDDGRSLRLVGIAPRQGAEESARFGAGLSGFAGRPLGLSVLGEPDRWGRLPARLTLAPAKPGEAGQDLALLMLRQGAALPLPEPGLAPCETPPKAPAPQAAAVDGHDLAAVKAQEGRYVMLEGRIASVGERSQRTYLNFSRRPKEAASIVLSRSLWRELERAGWTASRLGGKRLRAYGVLSGRDGLLLEVTARTALELID
jgi:hypothetical protein